MPAGVTCPASSMRWNRTLFGADHLLRAGAGQSTASIAARRRGSPDHRSSRSKAPLRRPPRSSRSSHDAEKPARRRSRWRDWPRTRYAISPVRRTRRAARGPGHASGLHETSIVQIAVNLCPQFGAKFASLRRSGRRWRRAPTHVSGSACCCSFTAPSRPLTHPVPTQGRRPRDDSQPSPDPARTQTCLAHLWSGNVPGRLDFGSDDPGRHESSQPAR
jgi:hypothetical protein